jgi:hypothetical protein
VGQFDKAYDRHTATAEFAEQLGALAAAHPGCYEHAAYVHLGAQHNFLDNHEAPQTVLACAVRWLRQGDCACNQQRTDSVAWASRHVRSRCPERVVWDLATRAELADEERGAVGAYPGGERRLHWLDVGRHTAVSLGLGEVRARVERGSNTVVVEEARTYLRVWLSPGLLDLGRPVGLRLGKQSWQLQARPSLRWLLQSLAQCGDPGLMAPACVTLRQAGGKGKWEVEQ